MSRRARGVYIASVAIGVAMLVLIGGRLLLTPVEGDLLVLASASKADRIEASTLELHSSAGWTPMGTFTAHDVPAAPETVTLLETKAAIGPYDEIRIGSDVVPVRITVQQTLLAPILLGIAGGRPLEQGVYAGSESVSLGLNELSGQMKQLPEFNLVDQFGRSFDSSSLAGHNVLIAAFHTTCHETCPLYTGLFLQLRRQLPSSVLMVEATTDPWDDTPAVLRQYSGAIGASWTFLTGTPAALTEFWKPFDVVLSTGDVHRSTLALVDSHGFIRSYYLGTPDVGGSLPAALSGLLNAQGHQLLSGHGDGWGQAQVIDSLNAFGGLATPSAGGEGQAPDFTLTTLSGYRVSLTQYRGRPVLINFWATYCVPCRVEMPLIQKLADQHPKLVTLLIDERDSPPAARGFVNELRIRSPVLLDEDGKAGDLYRVAGLPTTLFIRSDGGIEGRYLGQTNEQVLGSHIGAIGA